jgi:hypothetical protein
MVQQPHNTRRKYSDEQSEKCTILSINYALGSNVKSVQKPTIQIIRFLLDELGRFGKGKVGDDFRGEKSI